MEEINELTEEQKKSLLELDKNVMTILNAKFIAVKGWFTVTTIATLIIGLIPPIWYFLFIPGYFSFSSSLKLGWINKSIEEVKKEIQLLENELVVENG